MVSDLITASAQLRFQERSELMAALRECTQTVARGKP
jgi:hypothetical protein